MEQARLYDLKMRNEIQLRKNVEKDDRICLGSVFGLEKGLALHLHWMASALFTNEWDRIRSKRMIQCWSQDVYFMGWNGECHEKMCYGCMGQCDKMIDRFFNPLG